MKKEQREKTYHNNEEKFSISGSCFREENLLPPAEVKAIERRKKTVLD
jgi:hypothetical protein